MVCFRLVTITLQFVKVNRRPAVLIQGISGMNFFTCRGTAPCRDTKMTFRAVLSTARHGMEGQDGAEHGTEGVSTERRTARGCTSQVDVIVLVLSSIGASTTLYTRKVEHKPENIHRKNSHHTSHTLKLHIR